MSTDVPARDLVLSKLAMIPRESHPLRPFVVCDRPSERTRVLQENEHLGPVEVPKVGNRAALSCAPWAGRFSDDELGGGSRVGPDAHARRYAYSEIMRRCFGLDLDSCIRCGQRMHLVAQISDADVIEKILRHLGLPEPAPRSRSND